MARVGVLALLSVPSGVLAGTPSIFGTWCNGEGDEMLVDAEGLHGGEDTNCLWIDPQAEAEATENDLSCMQPRADGSEAQPVTLYDFTARLDGADHMIVDYGDGRAPFRLQRCAN